MRIVTFAAGLVVGYGIAYFVARKRGLPGAVALSNPTFVAANGQLAGRPPTGFVLMPPAPPPQQTASSTPPGMTQSPS